MLYSFSHLQLELQLLNIYSSFMVKLVGFGCKTFHSQRRAAIPLHRTSPNGELCGTLRIHRMGAASPRLIRVTPPARRARRREKAHPSYWAPFLCSSVRARLRSSGNVCNGEAEPGGTDWVSQLQLRVNSTGFMSEFKASAHPQVAEEIVAVARNGGPGPKET